MKSKNNHDVTLGAAVNEPQLVTLYAADGEEIQVSADKADGWLSRGFSRTKADPTATLAELEAALDAAKAPIRDYVSGVQQDGHIDAADTAAQVTAFAAMEVITSTFSRLVTDLSRLYPVRQGDAVTLVRGDEQLSVDPAQVESYEQEGWSRD